MELPSTFSKPPLELGWIGARFFPLVTVTQFVLRTITSPLSLRKATLGANMMTRKKGMSMNLFSFEEKLNGRRSLSVANIAAGILGIQWVMNV